MAGKQTLSAQPNVPNIHNSEKLLFLLSNRVIFPVSPILPNFCQNLFSNNRNLFSIKRCQISWEILIYVVKKCSSDMFTTGNLKKLKNTYIFTVNQHILFSKFGILGTFGLGLTIWFPGIPRHQLTWEKIQKVPRGFSHVNPHFSLQCVCTLQQTSY